MKHVIIGDLHGKDAWEEVDISSYDKVVFLGDYVDHWTLSDRFIYQNLQKVIELKRENFEKVELLLGNHDIQYLHYPHYLCSGFRPSMQRSLSFLFKENRDLFKVAYQRENSIISHAGITNKWYKEFSNHQIIKGMYDENVTVADLVNKVENTPYRYLLHQAGSSRGGEGAGGITWADRKELIADMLDGYHQIVGHTVIPKPEFVKETGKSSTFIDVLDTMAYFHEIEI
jgi:3',5'-cyclic AMP phosphodiesterase CpdA